MTGQTMDSCSNSESVSSTAIEKPLCTYLSLFDGTSKTFSDIEPYFNAVFSNNDSDAVHGRGITDDHQANTNNKENNNNNNNNNNPFQYLIDGTHPINLFTFQRLISHLLHQKMIATLEDIYFPDSSHVEYTVHWKNNVTSMVCHDVATVVRGKIRRVEPCRETRSVFAHWHSLIYQPVSSSKSTSSLLLSSSRLLMQYRQASIQRNRNKTRRVTSSSSSSFLLSSPSSSSSSTLSLSRWDYRSNVRQLMKSTLLQKS